MAAGCGLRTHNCRLWSREARLARRYRLGDLPTPMVWALSVVAEATGYARASLTLRYEGVNTVRWKCRSARAMNS